MAQVSAAVSDASSFILAFPSAFEHRISPSAFEHHFPAAIELLIHALCQACFIDSDSLFVISDS